MISCSLIDTEVTKLAKVLSTTSDFIKWLATILSIQLTIWTEFICYGHKQNLVITRNILEWQLVCNALHPGNELDLSRRSRFYMSGLTETRKKLLPMTFFSMVLNYNIHQIKKNGYNIARGYISLVNITVHIWYSIKDC